MPPDTHHLDPSAGYRLDHAAASDLAARYQVWRENEPALGVFADPAAVVRFMRRPGPASQKDGVLRALLAWARVEPLGGQLVLEVLRPGVLNLVGRVTRGSRDREELGAIVMLSVWERIRDYPLERRPRRVAANLLLDALHMTLVEVGRESSWRAAWSLAPVGTHTLDETPDTDVDGLLGRAVSAGAVSADEAELVLVTRVDGMPLSDFALRAGVSYNTLKLRRQRAERRLLVFLGFRSVPRGRQNRLSSFARVAGAGS